MKCALILAAILLSACAPSLDADRQAQLEAEADYHAHQAEERYNLDNYDPEYVADCLYYEELACEFE